MVVVGNAIVLASKEAHQANVLVAVPVISIISFCQCVGVQDRFVVNDVTFAANAVILCKSELSVFIVGVADDASDVTLGVIRLFVRVFVLDMLGITTHSTAKTQAALLLNVVSEACQSSIPVN